MDDISLKSTVHFHTLARAFVRTLTHISHLLAHTDSHWSLTDVSIAPGNADYISFTLHSNVYKKNKPSKVKRCELNAAQGSKNERRKSFFVPHVNEKPKRKNKTKQKQKSCLRRCAVVAGRDFVEGFAMKTKNKPGTQRPGPTRMQTLNRPQTGPKWSTTNMRNVDADEFSLFLFFFSEGRKEGRSVITGPAPSGSGRGRWAWPAPATSWRARWAPSRR